MLHAIEAVLFRLPVLCCSCCFVVAVLFFYEIERTVRRGGEREGGNQKQLTGEQRQSTSTK